MALTIGGAIALIILLVAAQELFYETHRRRYGLWRTARARHLWASPEERRSMWMAFTHRDPDPRVERSRLLLIAACAFVFVALVVLLSPGPAPSA